MDSHSEPKKAGQFAKGTFTTFTASIIIFFLGIGSSVTIARVLGPEGKGIYVLAALLPSLIVTFGNLGIGPATAYYAARGEFPRKLILGNNIFLSIVISSIGLVAGLIMIIFFRQSLFQGVAARYLYLTLTFIPVQIFSSYVRYVLLGIQRIKEFNFIQLMQAVFFLGFVAVALLVLKTAVTGTIIACLLSWLFVDLILLRKTMGIVGGVDLSINKSYIRHSVTYGIQAHLANILGFLNYRIDMLLVNGFVGAAAVGTYSVAVGIVEKIWIVSQAASTVLFPKVAAESDEERRKEFTPLVARTVLVVTALTAAVLAVFSRWIVLTLYSDAYLPSVRALQVLLFGVVAMSAGRVFSNDISGRGFPGLNVYIAVAAVAVNVVLNILWIPKYGIVGAAWASTVSYTASSIGALFIYCRLSDNRLIKIFLPQKSDWALYRKTTKYLIRWILDKVRTPR